MKIFPVIFCLLFILSGCGWLYSMGGSSTTSDFDISEAGLVVPEFEFVNQNGDAYGSKDLEGKLWLASMVFTHCPTVCPLMIPNKENLQNVMIDEDIDMKFISFTVDPKVDTPEHLQKYSKNIGAKDGYWYWLTGYEEEEIKEFASEGFRAIVQELEDSNDIMHSTRFFLVDGERNVIRNYDALEFDQTDIIADITSVYRSTK